MAFKSYRLPEPTQWVSLGGTTRDGKKNPTSITGRYLGRTIGKNQFDDTKEKVTFLLDTPDGVTGVNGTSNMVKVMDQSEQGFKRAEGRQPVGALCTITFVRLVPTKKGNPMKVFDIQFDSEDQAEVASFSEADNGANESYGDLNDDGDEEAEDNYEADSEPVAAVQANTGRTSVQELLAKRKKK